MRLTLIGLLVGLLALAANAYAGHAVQAEDAPKTPSNSEYHYGEIADPSVWPISAIGVVTFSLDFRHRRFCTGTLVAPKLALTAAHCLFDGKELVRPENVRFLAGLNRGVPAAFSTAERFIISKEFAPGQTITTTDWAVIVLREPLPLRPIPVKSVSRERLRLISNSNSIVQVGYGIERPNLPSIVRNCRVDAGPDDRAFVHWCLTNFGYSGAPILADLDGTVSVIGIGSGGKIRERLGLACSSRQFETTVVELMKSE